MENIVSIEIERLERRLEALRDQPQEALAPEGYCSLRRAEKISGYDYETVRRWCCIDETGTLGIKRGGRWYVSIARLVERTNEACPVNR